ncbi:MAG: hypothetical protein ACLGGX_11290 [Bdellovibrionia bacterium]
MGRIILLLPLFLMGCAFGKDPAVDNKKEVEERQKLRQTYAKIEGLYKGTLNANGTAQAVELLMFTDEVRDGVNSDGSDRYRLTLKGTFTRTNPAAASQLLDGRFIPETNEVILANPASTIGPDDVKTISARLVGNKILGEVKRRTGILGTLDVSLHSKSAELPESGNAREEENERIRRTLEQVVGSYQGVVLPPPQIAAPIAIGLEIFIVNVSVPGGTQPQLNAYFKRLDEPSGTLDLLVKVSYEADLNPPRLTATGSAGVGSYFISLEGTQVDRNTIRGIYKNQRGESADFELKRIIK